MTGFSRRSKRISQKLPVPRRPKLSSWRRCQRPYMQTHLGYPPAVLRRCNIVTPRHLNLGNLFSGHPIFKRKSLDDVIGTSDAHRTRPSEDSRLHHGYAARSVHRVQQHLDHAKFAPYCHIVGAGSAEAPDAALIFSRFCPRDASRRATHMH